MREPFQGNGLDVRRSRFDGNERPNFEKLEVWRLAHELTLKIYKLTRNFPQEEKYRLVDQICRAASSVPANIAEGEGRYQLNDQIHFLHIARGSLSELRYFLILSRDLGFASSEQEGELSALASTLHAKLHAFIAAKRRLLSSKIVEHRTSSVERAPGASKIVERRTSNLERRAEHAFNMIEIAISIGIIGIAVVSIMGLFAVGLNSANGAADDNTVATIVQAIMSDRASTPYTQATGTVTAPSTPGQLTDTSFSILALNSAAASWPYVLYFKKSGGAPVSDITGNVGKSNAAYYFEVDMWATNTQAASGLGVLDIRVSWPANTQLTNRPNISYFSTTFAQH